MITIIRDFVIPATYTLLPQALESDGATAMLLAIGLQESEFKHRKQVGGPARGFWQFEKGTRETLGGVTGILHHAKTCDLLSMALTHLRYGHLMRDAVDLHYVIEDNDVVACLFARLLLLTVPRRLPSFNEHDEAFVQYIQGWRPGAYTRGTASERDKIKNKFCRHFDEAWQHVRLQTT